MATRGTAVLPQHRLSHLAATQTPSNAATPPALPSHRAAASMPHPGTTATTHHPPPSGLRNNQPDTSLSTAVPNTRIAALLKTPSSSTIHVKTTTADNTLPPVIITTKVLSVVNSDGANQIHHEKTTQCISQNEGPRRSRVRRRQLHTPTHPSRQ